MKLSEIQHLGVSLNIQRDGKFESIGKGAHAKPGMLSFAESSRFLSQALGNSNISCMIVPAEMASSVPTNYGLILSDCPRTTFYGIHEALFNKTSFYLPGHDTQICSSAIVHPSAQISALDVVVEAGVLIEANVTIQRGTRVRKDAIIRAGCVIGADGFEFYRKGEMLTSVPHAGSVDIGEGAEIQALSVVEKAVYGGETKIGSYSKLGSRVLVAHNCSIGQSCLIAGGVVISGNVTVGDKVWIGPGAVITNAISLGDESRVEIGSCVVSSVEPSAKVCGVFAGEKHSMMKYMAHSGII